MFWRLIYASRTFSVVNVPFYILTILQLQLKTQTHTHKCNIPDFRVIELYLNEAVRFYRGISVQLRAEIFYYRECNTCTFLCSKDVVYFISFIGEMSFLHYKT
jgi:hypothetical protein